MRRFLAAALLAATAGYEVLNPPVNLAVARGVLRRVPQAIGPWRGTELDFGEAVTEELQADDVLIRRYEDGARSVWLCLVFHQNRRYGAHDPHLCYESQGFVLGPDRHARIDDGSPGGLEVNTFVAERKHRRRVVWYWWTTQGLATADVGAFRRRMALAGALDNRSWGSFVRVESVARDGDMAAATARVGEFASRLARELPAVFGSAAGQHGATPVSLLEQLAIAGLSFGHAVRHSRRPAAWLPWLLVLGAGLLALIALAWSAHPLLSWFMAPLLRASAGEETLRYPGLYLRLPRITGDIRFVLDAVIVPVACGGSALAFAALYAGGEPVAGNVLRETLRRSPAFVLAGLPAWLAEAGLRAGLAALPAIRLASLTRAFVPLAADLALLLVRAACGYAVVHAALARRGPAAAIASVPGSLRDGFLPAVVALLVLAAPLAALDALVAGPLAGFAGRVPESALGLAGLREVLRAVAGVIATGTLTLVWIGALAPREGG